jgi:HAD superfamily hydrolase (TIGR01549 family)
MTGGPRAVLFDAGMTLIHPSGQILVDELRAEGLEVPGGPRGAVAALVMAAEARHLPLPAGEDGTWRVATTWAMLLGLEAGRGARGCARALARPDLYDDLDPGTVPTLRGLRERGTVLGVISNSAGTVADDLAAFGLLDYLDVVVDSTVVGVEKPDRRIFEVALERLGLPGEDCWYVGDGLVNDVLGAQAAGLGRAVLYDRFESYAHLPGVPRITTLTQLLAVVPDQAGTARNR